MKTTRRRAIGFAAAVASLLAGTWACLDLTPVTANEIAPPPGADVRAVVPADAMPPAVDATFDASFDGDARVPRRDVMVILPPCQTCLGQPDMPGPGCMTELEGCLMDPSCAYVYGCAVASGCLLLQTSNDLLACADPCVIEAGITSETSDAGIVLAALAGCLVGACGGICMPSD
jgi:hypothetical protein